MLRSFILVSLLLFCNYAYGIIPIPKNKPTQLKVLVIPKPIKIDRSVSNYIPPQAFQYIPVIITEVETLMPELTMVYYIPALIEHESCISLSHSKCWNPKSELRTKRELGVGLGQLTKAYDAKGKLRFDSLSSMVGKYPRYLKELQWATIYQRPDLQIRAIVLMVKDNYDDLFMITNVNERLMMSDSAYNGGLNSLRKERTACGLTTGCNPQVWFKNVSEINLKGNKILYGDRTAFMINRHHVDDVFNTRMNKYRNYMLDQ